MATTMNQPNETSDAAAAPTSTAPAAPRTAPTSRMGRRAVLATATAAALCGVGALAAPRAISMAEAQGQSIARDAIRKEIGELEGVSLDAAINAAEVTRIGVNVVVLPLARFIALAGAGSLGLLLGAIDTARNLMATLHFNTSLLDAFRGVIVKWRDGAGSLPIALDAYLTADIGSAEAYLRALKRLAEHPRVS